MNSPRDDDPGILSSQISIIGEMCFHLRKFQKSKYMVETGTHNLIFIMTKMSDLNFQVRATVAIRKATSCRVIELLDAFVANGTIEALVGILDGFGPALLEKLEKKKKRTPEESIIRQIQINCQCILIQLCYRAQNIKRVERLDATNYINSFEKMTFSNPANKKVYVNTVLQYCSEN
mmetsp:Transcript_29513/g.44870  ORF Transcript_29513/g.44870 Transcript_29513/m.44870 type:complete len:177 (+) Transcript_29513:792-1322(+)